MDRKTPDSNHNFDGNMDSTNSSHVNGYMKPITSTSQRLEPGKKHCLPTGDSDARVNLLAKDGEKVEERSVYQVVCLHGSGSHHLHEAPHLE
ncbi:hypothetical protein ElyMa_001354600 [Elysia marginata]|uniref:Uncharacterized protein n=1 Tax=Elysia marginata TaxID=1093978 RepID=A0AAV4IMG2_9GAST|nr:hypothetical protein ElyMa_001354600 [Elysia marginata]